MTMAIITKIKKLLALSTSDNESEASSAYEKAHTLLKQYNLSLKDITPDNQYNIIEEEYISGMKSRKWKVMLIASVCEANYCLALKSQGMNTYSFKIVGKEHNVAGAEVMLNYLIETIDHLSKKLKAKERDSYKVGIVVSLTRRLKEEQDQDTTNCKALVVQEKSTIMQYFKNKHSHMEEKSMTISNNHIQPNAYLRGISDGNGISLNRQVDSTSLQGAFLL